MIYSGFFRRAVAFMVDMLIISVPTTLVFMPVLAAQFANVSSPDQLSPMQTGLVMMTVLSWQVISLLIAWLYFALMESSKHQATLGKKLLGIKVIGKDGNKIGFGRATGRFFAKLLSYLPANIGFIMAGFTCRKRALHDMIAETYVVKKSFEPGQELPETKSRKLLLVIVSIIWVGVLVGMNLLAPALSMTPTQAAAKQAAMRLLNLSSQNTRLDEPVRMEGVSFYQTAEGYRAVVVDPDSEEKFTLLLPNGTKQVCCQTFPSGNCEDTGFVPCAE